MTINRLRYLLGPAYALMNYESLQSIDGFTTMSSFRL